MIHSIGYSPCPSKKWLFTLCVCACHSTWYDCGKVALGTYVCWRLGLYGCLCRDADAYIVEVCQLLCTVGRWTVSQLLNHHTLHGCGQTHQYNWYLICPGLGFKTFHWLDKYKHIWSCHIVWTHTHTQKMHECGVLDSDVFSHVFCFAEQLHGCETVFVGEQHELIVHRRGESSLSTAIITFKIKHPLFLEGCSRFALSYALTLFQMFLLKSLSAKISWLLAAILITAPGSYSLVAVQCKKTEIYKTVCQDYVSVTNNKIWQQYNKKYSLFSFIS